MDLIPQESDHSPAGENYRVLARKYRPWRFDELIGQEPMVRTLTNAFSTGRVAQAWILTGVRGVGKTTTARILARALNYDRGDGGGPTVDMPELGRHCTAIMESRHLDVFEMDAASRTGIDDVREIVDGVRYAPASARYKVYIIDEVHMLSEKAFNAFLKTLEEPPPHVKFVFATTEIRKVPVTVLSRCQRFNLRRVDSDVLVRHLASIAGREGVSAEDEALAIIARASEGSVRDALSLLDHAIAHGDNVVRADDVRAMLGLTDRARIVELFGHVMRGEAAAALAGLALQYQEGADPSEVLGELAEFVHLVTRIKLAPKAADDPAVTETERQSGRRFAEALSMQTLARAWQMLLKGVAEVQLAQRPEQAADMVIVRLAYAATLPTPDEALKVLKENGALTAERPNPPRITSSGDNPPPRALAEAPRTAAQRAPAEANPSPQTTVAQAMQLRTFEDVVALVEARRDVKLKYAIERQVRVLHFEDGRLDFVPTADAPASLAGDLSRRLSEWTGRRWMVSIGAGEGAPTLFERAEAANADLRRGIAAHPNVRAVLDRFPGAVIVDVKQPAAPDAPPFASDNPLDGGDSIDPR